MATGKWKPKTNVALVKVVRKWVRRLQAQGFVVFKHAKGHSGAVGNEAADRRADRGRDGHRRTLREAMRARTIGAAAPQPAPP
eukprot:6239652-Pyramimonas_sp.AAC.1